MCFITPSNILKAKIARRDIIAFKSVYIRTGLKKVTIVSPVRGFEWKVGILYKANMECELLYKGKNVHAGFHCFKQKAAAKNYSGNTVVPIMIPKGAYYYENKSQFVSNRMVLLGSDIKIFEKVARVLKPIRKTK